MIFYVYTRRLAVSDFGDATRVTLLLSLVPVSPIEEGPTPQVPTRRLIPELLASESNVLATQLPNW